MASGFLIARANPTERPTSGLAAPTIVAAPVIGTPDFAQIVARYGPAVVNISVTELRKPTNNGSDSPWIPWRRGVPGFDPNDPFFEFFKHFEVPNGGAGGGRSMPLRGQGSGFIISSDGLILTNAHVVRDADEVTVKLTDRREFRAKVLGADPKTDVAVLKVEANNLPTAPLGKADSIAVGEWVLAIGSPFGFDNSATAGIVSAKRRSLPGDAFVPFIQTDVAVNPGNSGGPLFNARGDVIGINSQIYSATGGYEGISFAIPIDVALDVKDQILRTGHVVHARLGVTIQGVDQGLADSFKLARPEGALVANVDADGPAARAGLESGDVIRAVNGHAIITSGDLPVIVGEAKPGDTITLDIWRRGKPEKIYAKLGSVDDSTKAVSNTGGSTSKGRLGLTLRPLDLDERRDTGVHGGLMVEDVGGAAARAGIQAGDVLVAINGTAVRTVDQVREVVRTAGKSVALLVSRGGSQIFVPVHLG
jgi:serine protease Do